MSHESLEKVAAKRERIALSLTAATMVIYFGFILLVAFDKPLLGTRIGSGLSVGIVLGALVIVLSWVLTGIYVRWANAHYDAAVQAIAKKEKGA
jgi:uncharacterized membrane protein (DUF485 family)